MQEDFKEYLKEAREKFCYETQKYNVENNLQLRTEVDSFLIAYDQAVAKAFSLSGVMPTFVLFAEWLQYNGKWSLPEQQVKDFFKDQQKQN
jgi:hypothetical protein